ncbi:MAG: C2 domain-containing protein, partial [bacterium]
SINLYQGCSLLPISYESLSNPYLTISYFGRSLSSKEIKFSLNPVWNQRYQMEIDQFRDQRLCPHLIISLWSKETLAQDKYIGFAIVNVADLEEFYTRN